MLDQDLEAIDVEDLRSVRVCATILGGEVVKPGQRPACVKEAPAGFGRGIVWLMQRTAEGRLARSFWAFVEQLCFAKEIAREKWNKVD